MGGLGEVDLDVPHLILVLLELCVCFILGVEMGEDLVIDSQLEGLTLLDHIEGEPVQGERVLEGYVTGDFGLVHDLAVTCDLDLA